MPGHRGVVGERRHLVDHHAQPLGWAIGCRRGENVEQIDYNYMLNNDVNNRVMICGAKERSCAMSALQMSEKDEEEYVVSVDDVLKSLLLRDPSYSLPEVAAFLGHDLATLSKHYAHVIAELRGQPPARVSEAIIEASRGRAWGQTPPKRPQLEEEER